MDMQSMNGTNFASICQPVVSVLKKPRFCFKDPGLAKTYSTRTRRKFDTCLSEDCGLNDKKARRFSNLRALEGLKTQRFRPQYLFHLPVWCARLDSNQRPTESESVTLSSWATGAYGIHQCQRSIADFSQFVKDQFEKTSKIPARTLLKKHTSWIDKEILM